MSGLPHSGETESTPILERAVNVAFYGAVGLFAARGVFVHGMLPFIGDELMDSSDGRRLLEAVSETYDLQADAATQIESLSLRGLGALIDCDEADASSMTADQWGDSLDGVLSPEDFQTNSEYRIAVLDTLETLAQRHGLALLSPKQELERLDESGNFEEQVGIVQSYFERVGIDFEIENQPTYDEYYSPLDAKEFMADLLVAESAVPLKVREKAPTPNISIRFDRDEDWAGKYVPVINRIRYIGDMSGGPQRLQTTVRHEHAHRLDNHACGTIAWYIDPDYRLLDSGSEISDYAENNVLESKAETTLNLASSLQNDELTQRAELIKRRLESVQPGLGEYFVDLERLLGTYSREK